MIYLAPLGKRTNALEVWRPYSREEIPDRFLTTDSFQCQSQNRTTQASLHGQNIRQHVDRGIAVHLFVRAESKTAHGLAAPFVYCGDVDFASWQGDQPIMVTLQLRETMPARVWNTLGGAA